MTLTLLAFPPSLTDHFPFLSPSPVATAQEEQQNSESTNPAQPAPLTQEEQEAEVVDFFKIAMGAGSFAVPKAMQV